MHLLFDGGGGVFERSSPFSHLCPVFPLRFGASSCVFIRHLTAAVVFLHPST